MFKKNSLANLLKPDIQDCFRDVPYRLEFAKDL
jgi:hypothetical protein